MFVPNIHTGNVGLFGQLRARFFPGLQSSQHLGSSNPTDKYTPKHQNGAISQSESPGLVTRRKFLQGVTAVLGAGLLIPVFAACDDDGVSVSAETSDDDNDDGDNSQYETLTTQEMWERIGGPMSDEDRDKYSDNIIPTDPNERN